MSGTSLVTLSNETLTQVNAGIARPTYDRFALQQGIVHIGVGAFHRAHQALALDRLMNQGLASDWAICGVALLPSDEKLAKALKAQDCLYTSVEKFADGTKQARIIGSITEMLFGPDEMNLVLEKLSSPSIRVVSLTITEGGYNFDRVTGEFMADEPAIQRDLGHPDQPETVFGVLAAALRRRRNSGVEPFAVVSCDNIQGNGEVAKRMMVSFARLQDSDFADWIESTVPFPSSMVDRITPVTTEEDIRAVEHLIGVRDECPVVSEPFFQWVLEEGFPSGRPPLERAGVQVVPDVTPYEKMKLRLLNASHQGLCYFAHLKGHRLVHEACLEPDMSLFLRRFMDEEATPTLDPLPGVDLDAYKSELIERFQNPEVKDTVARLCTDSSDRIPKWLLDVVREQLAAGGPVTLSAAIVASWARYAEGVDEQGDPIDVVDPMRDELMDIAKTQRDTIEAFIANRELFGDLIDFPDFRNAYVAALQSLHHVGAAETLHALASDNNLAPTA